MDAEGRFCINDLHQASGGEKRHGPSYWLAIQQTRELIAELSDTEISVTEEIKNLQPVVTAQGFDRWQGTFVVKELVYAYAMWIKPSFHLQVIRAYDAMIASKKPLTPAEILHEMTGLLVDLEKRQRASEAITGLHHRVLETHEDRLLRLEAEPRANLVERGYFTIAGYANLRKIKVGDKLANSLGRAAARLSRKSDIPIEISADNRWGKVGSYHETILRDVFSVFDEDMGEVH
jgi:hypothetical protein